MHIERDEIVVDSVYGQNDSVGYIPGAYWDKRINAWRLPLSLQVIELVSKHHELSEDVMAEWMLLKSVKERMEKARSGEKVASFDMPLKGVEPWDHQKRAHQMAMVSMLCGGGGFGLLFDMGTGKTMTAVGIAGSMYKIGKVKKVLVMAPSSVLPEWTKTLQRFADFEWTAEECTGSPKKREQALQRLAEADGCAFAVINYESAWRTDAAILKYKPDLVICDESQRIKCHTAKQSKFAHKLAKVAPYRLILSGTPLQNSPLDFFSQYLFLDRSVFGSKWYGFRERYSVQKTGYNSFTRREFKQVVGYRNLEELTEKVHGIALRVENGVIDLPAELPPVMRYAKLTPAERKVYDELRDESIAELESGDTVVVANALSKILRLQQVTSGFTVNDEGEEVNVGHAKADAFAELVDDVVVEQGEKLVVFFRFIKDMEAIEKVLKEKGIGYVTLYGGTKQAERKESVEAFASDPDVQVFVGQLQASGTGIDGLQTSCHTACFYSNSYNAADYEQAKARINRSGQKKSCVFIHLVCEDTVDEKILGALKEKKNLSELVVNQGIKNVL